ncbi:MAG: NAD+ synthase [Myxococcota bacterium]|nr:NAD+ synthase [Myxococcota bacterium]
MKVALLQLNFTVGDLDGNAQKIIDAVKDATAQGADLCVTSELAVWGYPPRDLLLNKGFIEHCLELNSTIATALKDQAQTLLGTVESIDDDQGKGLYNTALLLENGEIKESFRKTLLPTYDVFDEARYFRCAEGQTILEIHGKRIAVTICEDIWNQPEFSISEKYTLDPLANLGTLQIHGLINISASPFSLEKHILRKELLQNIATKHGIPVAYCNQIGGNDELIFDGRSCFFGAQGQSLQQAQAFSEDILILDWDATSPKVQPTETHKVAEAWDALVLGVRDYMHKTGFKQCLLGLSGGIDSALTAAIAAEAAGPENVIGVLMPSPYSSEGSITDAQALVKNLGIRAFTLPIGDLMSSFEKALATPFAGMDTDTTEENIQSRIRGNLLMAMSNKYRAVLLTTGNKSELSVGYCTIYGDMSGGLAVISDAPKTLVYDLSHYANRDGEKIPQNTLDKPPSAELRPDQKDTDSLPDYDTLDTLLMHYVEEHETVAQVVARGFDEATVKRVARLVNIAEFKRRQAAPGLKITDRAFGMGWRMPIAKRTPDF